jgi:hypothetical protein
VVRIIHIKIPQNQIIVPIGKHVSGTCCRIRTSPHLNSLAVSTRFYNPADNKSAIK